MSILIGLDLGGDLSFYMELTTLFSSTLRLLQLSRLSFWLGLLITLDRLSKLLL